MPEGLSATEVGKEIAEHREHTTDDHSRRDRYVSIAEAVLLSLVAIMAAWSGYAAAKWGTDSSLSLAKASATRTKANQAAIEATQIRTLDSVDFNAAITAYAANNPLLFRVALKRLRPSALAAVEAWRATKPLTNPNAPADPSDMPQYQIPQQKQANTLNAEADAYFATGQSAAGTADKYVRLTVFLAAVLFLVGIGSRLPLPAMGWSESPACFSLYRWWSSSGFPDHRANWPLAAHRRAHADRSAVAQDQPARVARNGVPTVPTMLVGASALHSDLNERVFVTIYGLTPLAIRALGFALDAYARREQFSSPRKRAKRNRTNHLNCCPCSAGT